MREMAGHSRAALLPVEVVTQLLRHIHEPLLFFSAPILGLLSLKPKQITQITLRVFANRPIIMEEFVDRVGIQIIPLYNGNE